LGEEKKEREKKIREVARGLFLRAGHIFLAVPPGIFVAVRCN
jgi:hypothetical protein